MGPVETYWEKYRDAEGRWRWRLVEEHAGDRDILADSGQGYASESAVDAAIRTVTDRVATPPLELLEVRLVEG